MKLFTRSEVELHNTDESAWVILDNKVYDMSKFLDEHPGGNMVLMEQAGRDGTENFNDIGHSPDAIAMREAFYIGDIVQDEIWVYDSQNMKPWTPKKEVDVLNRNWIYTYVIPSIIAVAVLILYKSLS